MWLAVPIMMLFIRRFHPSASWRAKPSALARRAFLKVVLPDFAGVPDVRMDTGDGGQIGVWPRTILLTKASRRQCFPSVTRRTLNLILLLDISGSMQKTSS